MDTEAATDEATTGETTASTGIIEIRTEGQKHENHITANALTTKMTATETAVAGLALRQLTFARDHHKPRMGTAAA